MNTVIFENDGEIDLRSVSTFGCSVKETKNPIGFFGTGLKYAIAVLLREGHSVTLQSGGTEVEATVKKDMLRGMEFGFCFLGNQPLGFTTELGKNWEVWMAYRELYCNAKDELGCNIVAGDKPEAAAGKTRVIVTGEAFFKAHETRGEFILESSPVSKFGTVEIHSKPSQAFFYRGIKVMDLQKPALCTYNETGRVTLTEDRTAKEPSAVYYGLARAILCHADSAFLERALVAKTDNIESAFDYHGWTGCEPGADFFPTVKKLQRELLNKVNPSALRLWREKGNGFIDPRRINQTRIQSQILERAITFAERAGFALRGEYPIFIVETLGECGTLAMADRVGKQIFLTERLFQEGGTKMVASALIEEYLHLKFKFDDYSQEMQNYLFAKMISLAEELQGEPI